MNNLSWYYSDIIDESLICEYEKKHHVCFPQLFRSTVCAHNYGYPKPSQIDVDNRAVSVKCLLSFNETDEENVWNFTEILSFYGQHGNPFAIDNFGNIFFFSSGTDAIYFFDLETKEVKPVADGFDKFLDSLY